MQILVYGTVMGVIGAACWSVLWLQHNSRAKLYRIIAAWALSNADAHDTRVRRRAEYMAEAE
jgi:hypothetical protein